MILRILLAIGCDEYDHEKSLGGAERDARRVYEALLPPEVGDYDPDRSELLLSPTVNEARDAIRRVLFSSADIDTFTFFFAGHGAVESGSFYMLLKDTPRRGLSVTALSLGDLFRAVNEAAPAQTNIFIDACEAGGLITDLGILLKSELMGDRGTPGVTLVATAGQDEGAGETDVGGVGTLALLDIVEGRDPLNETASAYDLVEIGRRISTRLREEEEQTPVVWGLNLYGPPRFCRNVRAGGDPTQPLRGVLQAWPASSDNSVRQRFDSLWRAYSAVSEDWDARAFAAVVDPILKSLEATPEAQAAMVERLAAACLERAMLAQDPFRPAQVGAAFVTCLLPYLGHESVARQGGALLDQIADSLLVAAQQLADSLGADRYALLSRSGGGISDLYVVPMRVANTLGWIAAAGLILDEDDLRQSAAQTLFQTVLQLILEHYSTSVLALSDAQAAPYLVALARAQSLGLVDEAETLVGLLFNDLVAHRANVARGDIPATSILDFLEARASRDYSAVLELLERPDEFTAVVLLAAAVLGLQDEIDPHLWEIDGHILCTYVTNAYATFGQQQMEAGRNLVWTIGDTVFRIADLNLAQPDPIIAPAAPTSKSRCRACRAHISRSHTLVPSYINRFDAHAPGLTAEPGAFWQVTIYGRARRAAATGDCGADGV